MLLAHSEMAATSADFSEMLLAALIEMLFATRSLPARYHGNSPRWVK
jgi:hypothetical protein